MQLLTSKAPEPRSPLWIITEVLQAPLCTGRARTSPTKERKGQEAGRQGHTSQDEASGELSARGLAGSLPLNTAHSASHSQAPTSTPEELLHTERLAENGTLPPPGLLFWTPQKAPNKPVPVMRPPELPLSQRRWAGVD